MAEAALEPDPAVAGSAPSPRDSVFDPQDLSDVFAEFCDRQKSLLSTERFALACGAFGYKPRLEETMELVASLSTPPASGP